MPRPPRRLVAATAALLCLLAGPAWCTQPAASDPANQPRILLTPKRVEEYRSLRGTPAWRVYKSLIDGKVSNPDAYDDVANWYVAFLGPVTGDDRYCAHAVAAAGTLVDEDPRHRHFAREGYLRAADDLENLLLTLDWCRTSVSAEQKAEWVAFANEGVDRMWKSNASHWPMDDPHNNYWYGFIEATMLVALATEGDNPRAGEFRELFRRKVEDIMLPQWTAPAWSGGGGKEGTHYDKWHRRLYRTLAWWRDSTGEDYIARMTPTPAEQIDYWLHQVTPGRRFVFQWGDEAQDAQGPLYDSGRELLLILMTLAPESEQAQHAKDFLAHSPWADFTRRADRPLNFILDTSRIEPKPLAEKRELHLATPTNGSGKAFIRSSWDADANAVSYSYRGRERGAASSHDHIDKPGFQWWANGEFVVVDPNFYSRSGIAGGFLGGGSRLGNMVRLVGVLHDDLVKTQPAVLHARDATASPIPHYYHSFDMRRIWKTASTYRRDYVFFPPHVLVTFDHVAAPQDKAWQVNLPSPPKVDGDLAVVKTKSNTLRIRNLLPAGAHPSVRDWKAKPCCGTTFSNGHRLAWTDTAQDSISVKVLDIGDRVRAAQCTADGGGARCTLNLDGRPVTIRFVDDATGAVIE